MIRSIVMALLSAAVVTAATIPAENPHIYTGGRVTPDFTYDWPGVYFKTKFTGTSLKVRFAGDGQYNIFIDGTEQEKLYTQGPMQSYDVASGLTGGTHTLLISKVNETNSSTQQFGGFELDDTASLQEPEVSGRLIEYIGDSFMAGYAAESGSNSADHPDPNTAILDSTNTFKAFPAVAARTLGAEYMVHAYSGLGVHNDANGNKAQTLPAYYDYTLHSSKSAPWDFTARTPDIVVIGLQINDFNGKATQEEYESALNSFVESILLNYVGYPYIILNSTSVYQHAEAQIAVKNVVESQKAKGNKVFLFNYEYFELGFSAWNAVHWHPNVEEHAAVGAKLANHINDIVTEQGWPTKDIPKPPFTLITSAEKGTISVSPEKAEYDLDEKVTLTARAAEGYRFANWIGSGQSDNSPEITISMKRNMLIKAVFTPKQGTPGDDLVPLAEWKTEADSYGSSVAVSQSNNLISAEFTIAAQPDAKTWPWAILSASTGNSLEGATHIGLTYTGSVEFGIMLPQPATMDGTSYQAKLPPAESPREVIYSIEEQFARPGWSTGDVPLDLAKVRMVSFFPIIGSDGSGSFGISKLVVYGSSFGDVSVDPVNRLTSIRTAKITGDMKLQIHRSGNYTISLYQMNGKEIARISDRFDTGAHDMTRLTAGISPSVYAVVIRGVGAQVVQKIVLK